MMGSGNLHPLLSWHRSQGGGCATWFGRKKCFDKCWREKEECEGWCQGLRVRDHLLRGGVCKSQDVQEKGERKEECSVCMKEGVCFESVSHGWQLPGT